MTAGRDGHRVSVCIPARNEGETIGAIVDALVAARCADEVIVCDDGSSDATARIAARSGATVVPSPFPAGKGGAMRTALAEATGDLVVFLDADVHNFSATWVDRLVAPLLSDPGVQLVKGSYRRSLDGNPDEGGRVTELVARPLLEALFPQLAFVRQPLAGETAVRRRALDVVSLADGYAVEMALLLDAAREWGPGAIAQADLGERHHRNRALADLALQSREIIAAMFERAGIEVASDDAAFSTWGRYVSVAGQARSYQPTSQ